MKKNSKKKGFTLIELIVVIAILGILALIAIPKLGAFRETAQIASDKETARVVEKTILTGIASGDIKTDSAKTFTLTGTSGVISGGATGEDTWITNHIQKTPKLEKASQATFNVKTNGDVTTNITIDGTAASL